MIFQKFVSVSLSELLTFQLSLGILLYPITFLISDLVTEVYGKKHATYMVNVSIVASLLVMGFLYICDQITAVIWSPVNDDVFHQVFGIYSVATFASLVAIYLSQLLDISTFAWIKTQTHGKYLWLRTNISTIMAQIIDTLCVLAILCAFNVISWDKFFLLFSNGIWFKILAAICVTPLCYAGRFVLNRVHCDSVFNSSTL